MEKITISVHPVQNAAMEQKVKTGEFTSVAEAYRTAVREYLANHPTMGGAAACPAQ